MTRPSIASHPMAPVAALAVAIGGFGLAVVSSPAPAVSSSAEAAESQQTSPKNAGFEPGAYPLTYRSTHEPRSETSGCSPWDVSPAAMEAILQEMVRRGWQPPRSDVALASTQPNYRTQVEALTPDQPVRVASPRDSAPVETGDVVDTSIEPGADAPKSNTPEAVAAPATPKAPAPEPAAPETPSSSN